MTARARPSDAPLPSAIYEVQLERKGAVLFAFVFYRGDDHMMHVEEIAAAWPPLRATLARILEEKHGFNQEAAIATSVVLFDRIAADSGRSTQRVLVRGTA